VQVVWWSTLSEKYGEEIQAQSGIFAGEYGEQAQTDFRCVEYPDTKGYDENMSRLVLYERARLSSKTTWPVTH